MNATAALARSITWLSSKQTYYTARLLVDRDLVNDCYRAYGYFRWADDIVDATASDNVSPQTGDRRTSFIRRQEELIDHLYGGERPGDLMPQEEIIADLISHDDGQGEGSGLESFIRNFLAILEFDAGRKGQLISQQELTWYSSCLGMAVTDCIQYFIGNGHPYPDGENRYLGATAAHITHMLRDMVSDLADGYVNIPREYLEAHAISPADVDSPAFRAWVRGRVEQAREYFRDGKRYLDQLDVLRCKIAGFWYCARFEGVLDAIERDGYVLRAEYDEQGKLSAWLRTAWVAVSVTLRHVTRRRRRGSQPRHETPITESERQDSRVIRFNGDIHGPEGRDGGPGQGGRDGKGT
jgi:phytoene/squalene synthetase